MRARKKWIGWKSFMRQWFGSQANGRLALDERIAKEVVMGGMDAFLNFIMDAGGWVGVTIFIVVGAAFGLAVANAKKNVVPVEPEPDKDGKK